MPRALRITLTILAAAIALHAIAVVWRQNAKAAGLDFYIYFVNAQLASRTDLENIYAPDVQDRVGEEYFERAQRGHSELRRYDAQRRRRLDNVSSPFLYTTLRWVSRDYDFALQQYHALVLLAFVIGVVLTGWRARLPFFATLFVLAGLLYWYRGLEADLRVGNVNALQLAAIGAMLVIGARNRFVAAIVFGALLAFKPNLLFVFLLLVASRVIVRDWRNLRKEIAGGAIGGAAAFAIASISYGSPRVWLQWLTAANQFWHRLPTRMERNVAPALPWFHEYGTWVSYAIAALLVTTVCVAIARRKRIDDLLIVAAGLLIYLLSATVVWLHYMVLAIPAALALLRGRGTAAVSIAALLLIAEEPFERLAQTQAFPIETLLITPSLLALFVCVVWKLAASNDRPAAAAG
ncbi:MAG TPA: glycosyltransferase 87 family protein [Thermoanaerobaculia bacterium]|nr:glycosyltransferase 87 family protein [Thermoanaerobaculia bacterium]